MLFALAHTKPGGFYSNQNQYYLHGLANAGYGDLSSDWLANTSDPTPLFSWAVAIAYRLAGGLALQVAFALLLIGYFLSCWFLATGLPSFPQSTGGRWAFAAALIAVHSAILRYGSVAAFGTDYPWYFQAGLANQYVLGPGLQPSAFGVLLLTAVAAFAHGRPRLAAGCVAMACTLHSTYLLPGALLVLGMLGALLRRGQVRLAVHTAAVAFVGVLPVLAYTGYEFAPSSAESFAESQRIIAWIRIPHHADVNRWLDIVAGLQLVWIAFGLGLLRKTSVGEMLAIAAAGGLVLSLVQVATGNPTLALAFPWRISAVLVPATTVAALVLVARVAERVLPSNALAILGGTTILGCLIGAGFVYRDGLGYRQTAAEAELIRTVAELRSPGEVYLLPTNFPKPSTARGTGSLTFAPVATSDRPAIFELQRFRLGSGAACYVDFKSIPYRDVEVLEWHRRVTNAERWYAMPNWDSATIAELRDAGITHAIVPAGVAIASPHLDPVANTGAYRVFRVR